MLVSGGKKFAFKWSDAETYTLTASAVAADNQLTVGHAQKIYLFATYTPGASETSNYVTLIPEFSIDGGTTWFPVAHNVDGTPSGGISLVDVQQKQYKIGADAAISRMIELPAFMDGGTSGVALRVKALETGVVTNAGTIAVTGSVVY